MRLAAAHRLREVEGAVLGLAGQPLEAAPDQEFEAGREVVALEELAPVDLARRKILDLRNLLDEAVACDDGARGAKLPNYRYPHEFFPTPLDGAKCYVFKSSY